MSTTAFPPSSSDGSPAERAYLAWTLRSHSDKAAAFEELCAAQPELAPELRALHAKLEGLDALLARGELAASTAQQLTQALRSEDPSFTALLAELRARTSKDRYLTVGVLGEGGMGKVYEVEDTLLHVRRAKKVVLERKSWRGLLQPDAHALRRFMLEAETLSKLDHPGIVPILDYGVDEQERIYYVMPVVAGPTLADVLKAEREGSKEWTRTRILTELVKVCDALSYAHSLGIVHRDLKPSNIKLGEFGRLYVLDWGLSKELRVQGATQQARSAPDESALHAPTPARQQALTQQGTISGTPPYFSPEQASGEVDRIDERSDVYAIGAILYELICERAPYLELERTLTSEVLTARVIAGPPQPLAAIAKAMRKKVPAELEAICEKAMAREREGRYAKMRQLAADLRAFLEQRVVDAFESDSWSSRSRKWVRRNPLLAALACIVLVALPVAGSLANTVVATRADVAASHAARHARTVEGLLERAFSELALELHESAVASFATVLQLDPDNTEAIGGTALAHLASGQTETAVDFLAQRETGSLALRSLRIAVLKQLGRREDARHLEGAIQGQRSALQCFFEAQARIAASQDRSWAMATEAIDLYREAVLRSKVARPIYYYAWIMALAYANNDLLGREHAPREAAYLADVVRQHWPEETPALLHAALADRMAGKSDRALRQLLSMVDLPGYEARVWSSIGRACSELTRPDAALLAHQCAMEYAPLEAAHLINASAQLHELGDCDGAITLLSRASDLDPTDAASSYNLGVILGQVGQRYLEIVHLTEAARRAPLHTAAHYNLGRTWLSERNAAAAEHAFRGALASSPDHAEAHCNLGLALLMQRRYREGLEYRRSGDELGRLRPDWSYPSTDWVAAAQLLVDYEEVLLEAASCPSASAGFPLASRLQQRSLELSREPEIELRALFKAIRSTMDGHLVWMLGDALATLPCTDAQSCLADAKQFLKYGHLEHALKAIARACDLRPTSGDAVTQLAMLLVAAGRPHDALEPSRLACGLNPAQWLPATVLSTAQLCAGEFDVACSTMNALHAALPEHERTALPIERWVRDFEDMTRLAHQAESQDGLDTMALDARECVLAAMAYQRMKHPDRSASAYQRAFDLEPDLLRRGIVAPIEVLLPTDMESFHRFEAACSASLAAQQLASSAPDISSRWLEQSLQWVDQEVEELCAASKSGRMKNQTLGLRLGLLWADPRLQYVRDTPSSSIEGRRAFERALQALARE